MELHPTLLMVVKVSNPIDPDEDYELLVAASNEDEARKLVCDRKAGDVKIGYIDNLGIPAGESAKVIRRLGEP